jgi:hypothetical protein
MLHSWLFGLCLALQAWAAAVPPQIQRVQAFRARAGLPALPPQALARLGSANLATLTAAQREAAHALLARVNPRFRLAPDPADTPEIASLKAAIAQAKELTKRGALEDLQGIRSPQGAVDLAALEPLYEGADRRTTHPVVRDLLLDGAPAEALRFVRSNGLTRRDKNAAKQAATLPAVAALERHEKAVEQSLDRGEFSEALKHARELLAVVRAAGLRRNTELMLGMRAMALEARVRLEGARAVLGRRSLETGERVRVQRYGDCAVQQMYNHPLLEAVRRRLPYPRFLRAVERFFDEPVRKNGLLDVSTSVILRELGLDARRLPHPKNAADLAAALGKHGALLAGVTWNKPERLGSGRDHAVLIRGRQGERFIVIDSNHSRPQAYSFEELDLLKVGDLHGVAPLPGADLEAAAEAFAREYGKPDGFFGWLGRLFSR